MDNGPQSQTNLFTAYHSLLCERLLYFLSELHPMLRADMLCTLKAPGKLLAQSHPKNDFSGFWSLLTFFVAQHVSPDVDLYVASSVAVAIECFICAGDMFDDIEDGDLTPIVQHLGYARTLNVSSSLCFLAQKIIISLSTHQVVSNVIMRLLNVFSEASLNASAGQHEDLLAEQSSFKDFSQEKCLEIVEKKSGTLIKLACQLGAISAGADGEMYRCLSELGNLLGIAHQLDNDIHDLCNVLHDIDNTFVTDIAKIERKDIKTDVVRSKKTLPIIIAVQSESSLQEAFPFDIDLNEKRYQKAIYEGIIATRAISLLYRERARDYLQVIERQQPISLALRSLLGL